MSAEPAFFVAMGAVVMGGGFLAHAIRTSRQRQQAARWQDGTAFDEKLEDARADARAYRAFCEDYWLRASKLVTMARGVAVSPQIAEAEELASANAIKFKAWFQLAQGHEESLKHFESYNKTDRAQQLQKAADLQKIVVQIEELMTEAEAATPAIEMLEQQLPGLVAFELQVRKAS